MGWTQEANGSGCGWNLIQNNTRAQGPLRPLGPCYLVSPYDVFNQTFRVRITPGEGEDFIGVAMGFRRPLTANGEISTSTSEYIVFQWKQRQEKTTNPNIPRVTALEGCISPGQSRHRR